MYSIIVFLLKTSEIYVILKIAVVFVLTAGIPVRRMGRTAELRSETSHRFTDKSACTADINDI